MKVLMLLLLLHGIQSEKTLHQKCITPHGEVGTCLEVTKCIHLYRQYANNSTRAAAVKYLRRSLCSSKKREGMWLVCCGSHVNVLEGCGITKDSTPRITSGEKSEDHFPWMVAIQYKEGEQSPEFRCAGFLINSEFVMTAGHCLKEQPLHSVHVGVSNLTRYQDNKFNRKIEIMNITYKQDFNEDMDIGLIRIKPVKYTANIRWICLPSSKDAPSPEEFVLRGWGKNTQMVTPFTSVRETRLPLVEYDQCPLAFSRNLSRTSIYCAGGKMSVDSCEGDSGGALMNKTDPDGWTAFGIASWGSSDCTRGAPAIYTRIQYHMNWIEEQMFELLSQN